MSPAGALGRHQTWWTALGGLPAEELPAARDHLRQVGLPHLAGQRAGTLSGGQAQRVAIARALAQRPRVMLADEPVASLDPEAAQDIMRLLRRLAHRDGLAVLCVLHQVDLAFAYADRVVGMRDGRVAFDRRAPTCRATRCSGCIWRKPRERRLAPGRGRDAVAIALRTVGVVVAILVVVQSLIVVQARPQDLITGVHGMVDIIRRATPPDFSKLPDVAWPALETVDIAIFGTVAGVVMALPLAVLAATNVTPSRALYYASRATIGFTRAVPDLVWALLFVTAVGLGPFPGGLALAVHSIGMLGRLFAETIENMDMAPIDALSLTGANRMQVFTHGVVPTRAAGAAGDRAVSAGREHPLVAGPGLRRRRRYRLPAADRDEPVPVPRGVAAADRDLRHRVRRRKAVGGVPRAADLTRANL